MSANPARDTKRTLRGGLTRARAEALALLAWTLTVLAGASVAAAHPPAAMPGGFGPPSFPLPPRDLPAPRGPDSRPVPIDKAPKASSAAAFGQSVSTAARQEKLSDARIEQARKTARDNPALFETDRNGALAIRNEILAAGIKPASIARMRSAGFEILRDTPMDALKLHVVVLRKPSVQTAQAIEELQRIDPKGSYDQNHVFFPSALPGQQSASLKAGGEGGSGRASAGRSREVGLVDTGVQSSIRQFEHAVVVQRAFASTSALPADHGTQVGSILLAHPSAGAIGKLYVADIYGNSPRGGSAEALVAALAWLTAQRVPVINISLVGPPNVIVGTVVRAVLARGHLIVAPVGNDGPQARPLYPASYPDVIAVSGVDAIGRLLPEASRVPRVDFVASGIAVAPDSTGRVTQVRGTSFAAPVVSRHLASDMPVPGRGAAKKARAHLARQAHKPQDAAQVRGFGAGVVAP